MNYWTTEKMAEFHRQDIVNDIEQIRLVNLATQSRVYRPGLFTRTMHTFAVWMIATGKELHNRYELPATHCHKKTSNSFAG